MPIGLSVVMFGALGAFTRYAVDLVIERHTATVFPLSTLVINATGCLLAGAAVGLIERAHEPSWLTVGIVTGFLGGYTTFSLFALETHDLLRDGHGFTAAINVVGSVGVGVAAIYAGLLLVR